MTTPKTTPFAVTSKTTARLSNDLIWSKQMEGLTTTAVATLVYLIARHQITADDPHLSTFRFPLSDLYHYLYPGSEGNPNGSQRRLMRNCLAALSNIQAKVDLPKRAGVEVLLPRWWLDETDNTLEVSLSKFALDHIGIKKDFAIVYLDQVRRFRDQRSQRMLLLAYQFRGIAFEFFRTLPLPLVREFFDLQGPSYDTWDPIWKVLKRCALEVNTLVPEINLRLVPIKEKGKVIAVEFLSDPITLKVTEETAAYKP